MIIKIQTVANKKDQDICFNIRRKVFIKEQKISKNIEFDDEGINATYFLALYQEGGMIAVVGAMFMFLVYSLNKRSGEQANTLEDLKIENKGQSETLENMEGMIIKLIDRWNKSDETRDRRHEKMVEELNDQSSILMEIKGNLSRINGKH